MIDEQGEFLSRKVRDKRRMRVLSIDAMIGLHRRSPRGYGKVEMVSGPAVLRRYITIQGGQFAVESLVQSAQDRRFLDLRSERRFPVIIASKFNRHGRDRGCERGHILFEELQILPNIKGLLEGDVSSKTAGGYP